MKSTASGVQSAFSTSMKKVGSAIGVAFSAAAVISFGKKCVQVASETQSAWMGLSSILNGQGKSFKQANQFIQEYISDGLVPLNNAVTAYKNLAARGYSTTQIEQTLTALKDAAAFGRTASYSYGDAIQSATEGLKNENSILVDNAGVTKNVSKMWDDYAKSIGTTANKLTQQQKIQAEVQGIMQETKWQTGDAAKYTMTFAGKVAKLTATFERVKTAIGNVIIPILNLFIPAIQLALEALERFFTMLISVMAGLGLEMPDVTSLSGLTASATDAAAAIESTGTAAETAAKKAKKAFASYDEINVLSKSDSSGTNNSGAAAAASSQITSAVSGITEQTNSVLSSFLDPMISAWETKGQGLINSMKSAFDSFKGLFSEIGISFGNIWINGTAETTLVLILGILTNVFDIVGGISEAFKTAWSGGNGDIIIQGFADALNNLLWIADDIGVSIADWWNSESGQSFANTIVELFAKVATAADSITDSVKNIWENGGRDVFESLQNIVGNIIEIVSIILGYIADLYADLVEWFAPAASDRLQTVNDKLSVFNDFLEWLKTDGRPVLEGIVYTIGLVAAAWATYKTIQTAVTIASKAFSAAQAVVNAVMNANPISLVVAAIAALIAIIIVCVKHWDEIKAAATAAWDKIKETWQNVKDWFNNNVVVPIRDFFSGLWSSISSTASNAWTGIKNAFSKVGSFFGGIWDTIKTKLTNIGQKIGDSVGGAFKKAVNAVLSTIENVANAPIRAINKLLDVINTIPGISISKLNTFSLPRLAEGGWVAANNPQLAIVGDNRREGEIIAPESKIREVVEDALRRAGNSNVVQTVKIALEILIRYPDGRTVIKQINEAQIAEGRILLEV